MQSTTTHRPRRVALVIGLALALALALIPTGAGADHGRPVVEVTKAPVAPDGTTAGAVTDLIVTLVDPNPAIEGIPMFEGGTVEIGLADEFVNTGEGTNTVILLQGWPQSPPAAPAAFPWTTTIEGNTATLTMTADFLPGDNPGMKQIHLAFFGFENPSKPGRYPIDIVITPNPDSSDSIQTTAHAPIIPNVRPSVHAIALLSGPPGPPPPFFNPLWQTAALGEDGRQVGLYVWDRGGVPLVGAELVMDRPWRGRLLLDGRTVGLVGIRAPRGAREFGLVALDAVVEDGSPEGPSEQVDAFLTGVPVGQMLIQLQTDNTVPGDYVVRIAMLGGNSEVLRLTVED